MITARIASVANTRTLLSLGSFLICRHCFKYSFLFITALAEAVETCTYELVVRLTPLKIVLSRAEISSQVGPAVCTWICRENVIKSKGEF